MSVPVKVDGRGRITLGKKFAHRLVLLTQVDEDTVQVELAEAVPAREAWLHKNKAAKDAVLRGLEQSARGELVEGPDLNQD